MDLAVWESLTDVGMLLSIVIFLIQIPLMWLVAWRIFAADRWNGSGVR